MTAPYPYTVIDATNRPSFETNAVAGIAGINTIPKCITLYAPETPFLDLIAGEVTLRTFVFDFAVWGGIQLQANASGFTGGLKVEYALSLGGPYLPLGDDGDVSVDLSTGGVTFHEGDIRTRAAGAARPVYVKLSATGPITGLGNVYLIVGATPAVIPTPPSGCLGPCCPPFWDFDPSLYPDIWTLRTSIHNAQGDFSDVLNAVALDSPGDVLYSDGYYTATYPLASLDTGTLCCGAQTLEIPYNLDQILGTTLGNYFEAFPDDITTATPTYSDITSRLRMILPTDWSGYNMRLAEFDAADSYGAYVWLGIDSGRLLFFSSSGTGSTSTDIGPDSLVATGSCVDVIFRATVAGAGWNISAEVGPPTGPYASFGPVFMPWDSDGGANVGSPDLFAAWALAQAFGPSSIRVGRWQVISLS